MFGGHNLIVALAQNWSSLPITMLDRQIRLLLPESLWILWSWSLNHAQWSPFKFQLLKLLGFNFNYDTSAAETKDVVESLPLHVYS